MKATMKIKYYWTKIFNDLFHFYFCCQFFYNNKGEYWVKKIYRISKKPLMTKNDVVNNESFCHSGAKRRNP
jgi:hypothetical protein